MTPQSRHGADTEELRQEVDRARHDLGETVEALAAKADVKTIAREKAAHARSAARDRAVSARQAAAARASSAREAATSERARTTARTGGAVVASAGAAIALVTVWLRRRGTGTYGKGRFSKGYLRKGSFGRGHLGRGFGPVRFGMRRRKGRMPAVRLRLRRGRRASARFRRPF